MSVKIKRIGTDLQVLAGVETLPEGEMIELFTAEEISALDRERREWFQLQMPSFLRGDEDEDARDLFDL
ncbi:MAG: hypothetical protein VKN83_11080 [Cyanobacteriota bacterium]|nr:hypothetical protein [Cyanobacteriota bacterium]